jgi:nucleoid-associated protein YgaU
VTRRLLPLAWVAAVALLVAIGPSPYAAVRLLRSPMAAAASPEAALDTAAAALAAVVLGWLLLGYLCVLGGRGAGVVARCSRRLSRLLLPRTVRRLLEAATGVSLLMVTATPAVAGPMLVTTPAAASGTVVTATAAPSAADPERLPSLDRPATTSLVLAPVPAVPPPVLAPTPPSASPAPPAPVPRGHLPVAPSTPGVTAGSTPDEIVVHRGDCLWSVVSRALGPSASDAEIAQAWPRWYAANRSVVGPDPDLLLPGQRLRAPSASP